MYLQRLVLDVVAGVPWAAVIGWGVAVVGSLVNVLLIVRWFSKNPVR
jgi:hypothetical protein